MKKTSQTYDPAPLTGEVLDPSPDREEALRFLAQHGVKPPRVKSYRSIEEAVAAIMAAETGTPPRERGR